MHELYLLARRLTPPAGQPTEWQLHVILIRAFMYARPFGGSSPRCCVARRLAHRRYHQRRRLLVLPVLKGLLFKLADKVWLLKLLGYVAACSRRLSPTVAATATRPCAVHSALGGLVNRQCGIAAFDSSDPAGNKV
jgi:hypothetical protein